MILGALDFYWIELRAIVETRLAEVSIFVLFGWYYK